MALKKFNVAFIVAVDVEVEESLIEEVLKPDWAADFYDLQTPEAVARHLAYNYLRNRVGVKVLDGFAHRPGDDVAYSNEVWEEP